MRYSRSRALLPLLYLSFLLISSAVQSQTGPVPSFRWQVGEELVYKVKWTFLRLGTVRLSVVDSLNLGGHSVHRVRLNLDSNPMLIFVNLHSEFECYIDSLFRPLLYITAEREEHRRANFVYQFDFDKKVMYFDKINPTDSSLVNRQAVNLTDNVYEGVSLAMYARAHVAQAGQSKLVTFFEDKFGTININFYGPDDPVKIGARDEPINSCRLDGNLNIKGIAGLTGPFEGWFSCDSRRVPLRAKMKVFIGNVNVELEKWQNWDPAAAQNK